MTLLFIALTACAPADLGGNEDELGQPRSLLANCVRDGGGEQLNLRYDSDGYPSSAEWADGEVSYQERSILDALGRPVVTERSSPQVGVYRHTESSYIQDTWKLDSVRDVVFEEELRHQYSWARGGYMVEDGSECFQYVDLGVGIRPGMHQIFCDGEQAVLTRYRWQSDRLVELERTSAPDGILRILYTYDALGRLSSELRETDSGADGEYEESSLADYTWACASD